MEVRERNLLRDLARQFLGKTQHPSQRKLVHEWTLHNDLQPGSPKVLIYPDGDGAWLEIIPDQSLVLDDPFARGIERMLRQKIFHLTHLHDDSVFEPVVRIPLAGCYSGYQYGDDQQKTAWGLEVRRHASSARGGAHGFISSLNTDADFEVLLSHHLDFVIDEQKTSRILDSYQDVFYGILPVETVLAGSMFPVNPLQELVHLRGLEGLMMDLYDIPELFHKVMAHMAKERLSLLKRLEVEGRLALNNRDHYTGNGGLGYTAQLPRSEHPGGSANLNDLWGTGDAQEFTDVSVEMFREFVLPYQVEVLKEFGLVCYGCCENLDNKLDDVLGIPNLRRVSVSPWTRIHPAAEKMQRECIYSRKPNPGFVVGGFDEDAARKDIMDVLQHRNECQLEFILKDIRTCSGNPSSLVSWVDLAQSLCKT